MYVCMYDPNQIANKMYLANCLIVDFLVHVAILSPCKIMLENIVSIQDIFATQSTNTRIQIFQCAS